MNKFATFKLILLLQLAACQRPHGSLDDLVDYIFKSDGNTFTSTTPKTTDHKSCGLGKVCVPKFLCSNDSFNTNGENIIDIRINMDSTCEYLEVCCHLEKKRDTPVIAISQSHEGCGHRNPNGVAFKISGAQNRETEFGEFPWMVAILREESNTFECGGSLIAPNVILSATHCVRNKAPETLIVRAGEWDTQTKSEVLPHQDRNISEIIVHENYNNILYNDVALLILASPFILDKHIQPICLPEFNAVFDSSRCFATGWGKDKFGKEGQYQLILKKIDLPIVPRFLCQQNLRGTRLGRYFSLHESFICAGGEKDKDTCQGDGGSPLVCPIPGEPNRYFQAGIVAWGIGCGEENVPGVYANVPYLSSWIKRKLITRNIDFSYFTP